MNGGGHYTDYTIYGHLLTDYISQFASKNPGFRRRISVPALTVPPKAE